MAGFVLLAANDSLQNAIAEGDTRTLSFHHVHTNEDITVTFKRNGRYDQAALKKLDWFMRDWRKEQETHMDPHLFDLLWETYREVGATQPIDVICGYRSAGTNAMLRARSTGVAQFSQHINGQAIDFFIPGVPLAEIRKVGLRLQRGGVGFYPTSGSPFVHMDTGTIRHWPRIARAELEKIFPNGRTVHIPADGRPLPGYALALADVERHGHVPSGMSLEAARGAGVITASEEHLAERPKPERGLLARLFGIGKDEPEERAKPAPRHARAPVKVASLSPPKRIATERFVPLPTARPRAIEVAALVPKQRPGGQTYTTASLPSTDFDKRVAWRGDVEIGPALPPPKQKPAFELASIDPVSTGSTPRAALSYAMDSAPPPATRARPMGSNMPRMPATATIVPAPADTTVVQKAPLTAAMAIGGQRFDSPWLRAAMMTPSVSDFMTATRLGRVDPRWQARLLDKPSLSLVMMFSADPQPGLLTDRFSGSAVVFLATATFSNQTASLR
jgi:uncharacterized protein YcbK (DUF882 family)